MNKLVYLFELDSVRKSQKEVEKAQKALYEEIVLNGNIVVMTMNQISDSLGFLIAVNNNATTKHILALFQAGVLRVSSYRRNDGTTITTPSQYLQTQIDQYHSDGQTRFYFFGWFIENEDDDLIKTIKTALQYNDPGIIDNFREKSRHTIKSWDDETKLDALEDIETFVRMILQMSGDTLSINPAKNTSSRTMMTFLGMLKQKWAIQKAGGRRLSFSPETVDRALSKIDELQVELRKNNKNVNKRSDWFMALRKTHDTADQIQMAEAILDLCYNYACEDSISGISRHYSDDDSFFKDFLNRLHLYWDEGKSGMHKFLADEGNSYRLNCVPEKWHYLSEVMRYTHTPQERGVIRNYSSTRKEGGLDNLRQRSIEYSKTPVTEVEYEKNTHQENTNWNLRIIIAFSRIIITVFVYMFLFYCELPVNFTPK